MRAHIAIFSCPAPALLYPTLSVVAAMVRRHYRVTYVTSERFAGEVASLGAEVLRCPRLDSPFNQDDDDAMPIEHRYARDLESLASKTFSVIWPFYQRNKPDLLIYDLSASSGLLVADKTGVPAIRMSNQFDFTKITLNDPVIPLQFKQRLHDSERRLNSFFAAQESDKKDFILDGHDRTFFFYLDDLQLQGSLLGTRAFYAARCTAERPTVTPWKRPTPRNKPSVLVASSTTYNQDPQYYKSCLAALSRLGWEIFLAAGNNTIADFGSLPANCQPVPNIPLVSVMPHVDLLITGAGMATAMEAVYHGVPMLMLTSGHAELEAYGQQFHNCGLGLHLSQTQASPDNVARHAILMLNDSRLLLGLRRLQETLRRSAGAEELVNWLEECVDLRPSVTDRFGRESLATL